MKESIWTRDLLDNPFGRFLRGFIFPALLVSVGLKEIISGEATFKRFTYTGFDAICIGIGVICLGLISAIGYNPWFARLPEVQKRAAVIFCGLLFIAAFATALLRNV
ncbi:hypothetical protein [Oleiharenicola lentus]|uniref:hypothetical protein n=1 Tax=Oleiharenicola lentus TaxID=2508720 RepID=UPI003F676D70